MNVGIRMRGGLLAALILLAMPVAAMLVSSPTVAQTVSSIEVEGNQRVTTGLGDLDVLEQAGFDQRFQAVIDLRLIQAPAGIRSEIRPDGLDFDSPVAFDLDRRRGLSDGRRRYRHGEHDQGGQQACPHSHSNIHASRTLVIASGR